MEGESDETGELAYNLSLAKAKMESAEAAIEGFKNKTASEYESILDEMQAKLADAEIARKGVRSKEELLSELDTSHEQSKKQQRYEVLSQIDTSLETTKAELQGLEADLRLNKIGLNLYENSRDENGKPISVSAASVKQVDTLLDMVDTLDSQIKM